MTDGDGDITSGNMGVVDNRLISTPQRNTGVGDVNGGTLFPGQVHMSSHRATASMYPMTQHPSGLSSVDQVPDRYNLIFVPFTGVDNNKWCVTFGAGLLFCETIEAYTWLLKAFLEAHNKQPTHVLTNQDPALRPAVGEVAHNSEFRAAIHKLVWNIYIKPETFERWWGKLLEKYGVEDHEWLRDMYNIKELWVPTYRQRVVDFKAADRAHEFKTGLAIEKHCMLLYSLAIFVEVRKEILKGLLDCYTTGVEEVDGRRIYTVTHLDNRLKLTQCRTLQHAPVTCGAVSDIFAGIFSASSGKQRWTKYWISMWYGVDMSPVTLTRNNLVDCFSEALEDVVGDRAAMEDFIEKIKAWRKELTDARRGKIIVEATKTQVMADMLGVLVQGDSSTLVSCSNPQGVCNKGCGTNKRMIGSGERVAQNHQKPQRLCRICNQYVTGHDLRNCPEKRTNAEP
ncbi:protein FAR1-RELATED SEQUENCE 4-like [Helianthus annuus]|uniref:protein FAR1-RELATED SEQUENCE 4-like n=1 Tax=Helianthus annuus TaxID=4232 RepID=UPI000B8F36E6|nr:protein FAR1-RELATED SEQUENCE 4-like [Helianthus annuus]